MPYFEWTNDLVIDHGLIDQDHRQLVDLVNQLHTVTVLGQSQEVVSEILVTLISHIRDHLQREERRMSNLQFPNLADHQRGHVQLMEEMHGLQKKYVTGRITVATQLSAVLRDCLMLHTRRSDREIKFFLRQTHAIKALPLTRLSGSHHTDLEPKK